MHVGELPAQWLKGLARSHHLLLLRGFAAFADAESLTRYCHDFGEVSCCRPFGAVLELVEQEGAEDHIFANNYVPLHWDGMYLETVPEFQVFHCVDAPGDSDGGRAPSARPRRRCNWPTVASWNSGAAPAAGTSAARRTGQQPLGGADSRAPPAPRIPHPAFLRTAGRGRRQLHQPLRVPLRRHRPGTARRTASTALRRCLYHPQAHLRPPLARATTW